MSRENCPRGRVLLESLRPHVARRGGRRLLAGPRPGVHPPPPPEPARLPRRRRTDGRVPAAVRRRGAAARGDRGERARGVRGATDRRASRRGVLPPRPRTPTVARVAPPPPSHTRRRSARPRRTAAGRKTGRATTAETRRRALPRRPRAGGRSARSWRSAAITWPRSRRSCCWITRRAGGAGRVDGRERGTACRRRRGRRPLARRAGRRAASASVNGRDLLFLSQIGRKSDGTLF